MHSHPERDRLLEHPRAHAVVADQDDVPTRVAHRRGGEKG
jgi:hypothetical protein